MYRSQWRFVQLLASTFWKGWRIEFLLNLKQRQKWQFVLQNLKVDDVLLFRDRDVVRNQWTLGIILLCSRAKITWKMGNVMFKRSAHDRSCETPMRVNFVWTIVFFTFILNVRSHFFAFAFCSTTIWFDHIRREVSCLVKRINLEGVYSCKRIAKTCSCIHHVDCCVNDWWFYG